MSLPLSIALYFTIWWVMLFTVLPFVGARQGEVGTVVPGTPADAPVKPQLRRLFAINTIVATVVFALVWFVVTQQMVRLETFEPATGRVSNQSAPPSSAAGKSAK
jgi:predicted secreted protein